MTTAPAHSPTEERAEMLRLSDALVEAGAKVNFTTTPEGQITRIGILSFPSVAAFAKAIAGLGYEASYSAGLGWKFTKAEHG